jgi:hypothetical protein
MFRSIRRHLNPTSLIAMVALFAALGGVSYAAATIDGKDIKNKSVAGKKLKNKTVTGGKVKNDSLTGAQVNESTLGKVPSATNADQAGSAATATNAQNAENAVNAQNAVKATTADSATTAANATAIGDNTVSSTNVQDGSLTGHDVGRRAGSKTFDFGSIGANACDAFAINIDAGGADMRNDAFAMTFEQSWPTGLTFSTEESDSVGYVRINVCNVTNAVLNPGLETFRWVAFDV